MEIIDVVLSAGRAAVELVLFVLLPMMVVMLSVMRLLEARGVLDWVVTRIAPVLKPAGLTGLSVFAALQISFVSFSAPVATLTMMQQRGVSDRHLAATLAMVFAMAQANVLFPEAAMGLRLGTALLFSLMGGLVASASTYYVFGRRLSTLEQPLNDKMPHPVVEDAKGMLAVINRAGAEAFRVAIGAMPMLVLSLVVVTIFRRLGLVDWLTLQLGPLLAAAHVDPVLILPTLTKYLGGGTAVLGVMDDLRRSGMIDARLINASAGWLVHAFDIPGVAVLISAGPRVAAVWKVAAYGACIGIGIRTACHILLS